jgi:hypothetical protein
MAEDSGLISFADFREFMFHKIVPVEDITDHAGEPISKILPFWRKNDLLPFIPKGQHLQLSFASLIWLRILDTLRQFSYPIGHVRKVCDYFFKDAYNDGLPERNMKENLKRLKTIKKGGTLTEEDTRTLEQLEFFLADDKLLYILKFDINYLTNLVTECISAREERGVMIYPDGRVGETNGIGVITHGKYTVSLQEPHIYLSITHFLKDFIDSDQLSTIFMPQILNDNERKVLREMKNRNLREISITLQNGEVTRVKSTKEGVLTDKQAKEIREILGLKNYQSITLDTRDATTISFKKTNKKI